MANQPKKGWRQGSTSADRGKGSSARRWQQVDPTVGGGRKPLSRSTKIGLALFALLAVIAGMIWVIYWLRPIREVRLVLLDAGGHEANLAVPHNAAGRQGLLGLESWARNEPKIEVKKTEWTTQGDSLTKAFDGPRARTLILFVNAHGGVDTGNAYFFPQDVNLKDKNQLQRLDQLLDHLKQLPSGTKKLLILDATQITAHWQAGMVHNDFVRVLQADPRLKEIENLLIMTSTDEDQASWVSEEWRRSIFTHYLIEGLRGGADQTSQGGDGNGRITALELYRYVHKNVKHWVRHNREALQEPRLLGSEQLAQDMELVAADSSYTPASAASVPMFTVPPELQNAWAECDQLRQTPPSPAAYTPHWWRQYLDTLLRYEQLVRADDKETAPRLLGELNDLKERITRAQRLERDSLQNSLAMPAALGWKLPAQLEQRLSKEFDRLWEERAEPEAFKKMLAKLQDPAANKWQRQLLRIRLDGLLVSRAAQNPGPDLKDVARILPALDEAIGVRPAEAHYLIMLQRDLAEKPPKAELLSKSLQLRQLAEEAALGLQVPGDAKAAPPAYCEQVYPWIRKKVEEADQKRRLGQDLLFAADAKSGAEAERLLDEALELYKSAQKDALDLRKAMRLRDELYVELPYYTQWLVRSTTPDDPNEAALLGLWEDLHELRRLLDDSDLKGATDKLVPRVMEKSEAVAKAMTTLRNAFRLRSEERNPVLQKRWHEIEDLLMVPFMAPATRTDLLQNSRQITHKLNVETDRAAEQLGLTREKNQELARMQAQRQARFALAVLGKDRFDRPHTQPDFATVEGWVRRPEEGQWWRTFDKVGEQVGKQWAEMGREAQQLTLAARQSDLEQSASQLRTAARLARQLNGAMVVTWLKPELSEERLDPVGDRQRLQLHDLFCWQAERTYLDHWSAEDPKKPFYRDAGLLYVREALALVNPDSPDVTREQKERRLRTVREMEKKLKTPAEVTAKWSSDEKRFQPGPGLYQVTDETGLRCIYDVEAPVGMPAGYPVVWAKKGEGLVASAGDGDRRVLRKVGPEPGASVLVYDLVPEASTRDTTKHIFQGVYRGQRFGVESTIDLFQRPDLVFFQPEMPRTARLAMQADPELMRRIGASYSAIAIVLDCSGSMKSRNPKDGPTRFEKALNALEQVMRTLPRGVKVSFRAFAQEGDTNLESKLLRTSKTWDPNQLFDFMQEVRALKPYGYTPLVRSIWKARKDFPDNFTGARTIVVLTDGADSEFKKDLELQQKGKTITEFMQNEFKESNTLINVVGFEVSDEEKKDQQEFEQAIRKLGGQYYDVQDSKQLVKYLGKAMLDLHFWIEGESGSVAKGQLPQEGANISSFRENFRWIHELVPGTYRVRVRSDKAYEQVIRVEAGDSLVVNLEASRDGLQFRRDQYASSHYLRNFARTVRMKKVKDWLLAVLQNERTRDGLQLMATLENDQGAIAPKDSLRQVKPGFTWFEVTTSGEKGVPAPHLRISPLRDYPAPAWSLDVKSWPAGVTPSLEVWWHDDVPRSPNRLLKDRDFKTLADLTGKEVDVEVFNQEESAKITVESVRQERIKAETQPGRIQNDVDCLVVRLRYPPGKPFFVRLPESLDTVGFEHRFYSKAGRYTGVFWNVTQEQARDLKSLEFISVENVKRKASYHQEKLDLGPSTTRRPQRPSDARE